MIGGLGNDTYIVDNAADVVTEASALATEIDTVHSSVTRTLPANVENLLLTGSAAINGNGNTLANRITGNAANNGLNGGAGADSMAGGLGNDTYIVDNAADVVTEASALATEIDTVHSSVNRVLGANQENLVLTGTAINGTGNNLANRLTGNASNNSLNGGAGADSMAGGLGNDLYIVDNASDVVTETSTLATEIDTVQSSVNRTLGANQENLVLIGTGSINGAGNGLNNRMTGNAVANTLNGGAGNDVLIGGDGNDILAGAVVGSAPFGAAEIDSLTGGAGNDIFILGIAAARLYDDGAAGTPGVGGYALITDFSVGDKLQLKGAAAQYRFGGSPVGLPVGQGLYHDSNASGAFNAGDELIAIIQGPNAANALTGAVVV
jgi:Ca2+-binding RTX toxin-like protein